ncbi:MAG: hypothetical protein AB8G26_05260 [Ilumatobacter sp.]
MNDVGRAGSGSPWTVMLAFVLTAFIAAGAVAVYFVAADNDTVPTSAGQAGTGREEIRAVEPADAGEPATSVSDSTATTTEPTVASSVSTESDPTTTPAPTTQPEPDPTPAPTPEPTPAPIPVPAALSSGTASEVIGDYLRAADGGELDDAWAMLSGAYQARYIDGFAGFSRFWGDRVRLAGPASPNIDVVMSDADSILVHTTLWYDVCNEDLGVIERSTERIEIGILRIDGQLVIDTYTFLGLVENPEQGPC